MAKDPAILWYWGDWTTGTMLLSRVQKVAYMDLLCAQFNNGALSLEEVKIILGSDYGHMWNVLSKKFSGRTPDGKFFNERLHCEQLKRKEKSQKLAANANKRWGN